ncbi:ubiquinone/menaquinone biosynthesis C-methylase UbiE [Thiogranum longum]|uniref:Arsenite methyltransferase n=1 Tax=Thiogranum longum TaxID=1537524 RepID=A0A4R1HB27_9GAMM|nr:methyltransferase domain-containing protein [Thiogranum longum]TCK19164.1 ubiquinone/menaquinone biosynthesis C-methylase UbiE [Thiogranum longum]
MSSCDETKMQTELIALYTKLAEKPDSDFGWSKGKANARQLGYSDAWLDQLPDVVWESSAAVGNPFKLGEIGPGQTVVDIGCGAGADACVAALLVGDMGKVIGVDCTPAMIDKSRDNARHAALDNIEFHEADIANLAIADNSVDVVISNGAINLSENKDKVFQELYRILKPGGRLQIADMVRESEDCCSAVSDAESWADCIQGTLPADKLLEIITNAGFIDAELVELTGYRTSASTNGALFRALHP